jgi:hypothetical protein
MDTGSLSLEVGLEMLVPPGLNPDSSVVQPISQSLSRSSHAGSEIDYIAGMEVF